MPIATVLGIVLAIALAGCQAAAPAPTGTPLQSPLPTPASAPTTTPGTTSGEVPTEAPATAGPTAGPTESPAESPVAGYPLELVGQDGTTVTLEARPERIVSLTPATTEILFALGAGDRTVGRGDYDDYPPEATQLPGVAAFTGVNHEALVALEPDLVLAGGNFFTPPADIERIRELGIPVLVLYAPTFSAVLDDIRLIGQAVDTAVEAEQLVADMQARADEVTTAVEALERRRVFYQIGSEPEIYAPAPGSFIADMIVLAGGEPITTGDPAVFAIAVEELVELDPEVIVVGDAQWGVCPSDVAARPGWGTMTAVAESAIRPVNDTIVTRPGPRLAEGLAELALAIHPEAAIAPPADQLELCPE
ncbi:MAG TPA: ABC transporter substrate-binding protein [Candidatus Limnocylindrales bacterium]|nr:ABC transporter substrate-binding protein [Candidatus Limnocylindrales bacterium]